jgi:antitoxin (DNA-binding transcriptional repressor) of toxin-antitoxin stability system
MKVTMTDLHRRTAKVMGSVIHANETVEITDNGNVVAKIVPQKRCNPEKVYQLLREMGKVGPIHIKPRT